MRHSLLCLILALAPLAAGANAVPPMQTVGGAQAARARATVIPWQYQLSDLVRSETEANGQVSQYLDMPVLDSFLATIADYVQISPPRFDNDAERADATDKLTHIITVLVGLDTGDNVDVNILRREAFAQSLACNLDIPGACQKTDFAYGRLLKRTPDEPTANYLYGSFLAAMPSKGKVAERYLQKSLKLGVKRANYNLGILYLSLGQKRKALGCLQKYAADYPDDANAAKLIADIKRGEVKASPKP
ncbi:MAG: tetratricopeptide repeat protein [Bacillota bacterium]